MENLYNDICKLYSLEEAEPLTEEQIAAMLNARFEAVRQTANTLKLQMLGVGFALVQAEIEPSTSTEPTVTPAWQE